MTTSKLPMPAISRRSLLIGASALGMAAGLPGLRISAAQAQDEWGATLSAAEAEGAVSIQGPLNEKYRASIETFRQAFPKITLNYTATSGDDFEARYTAERRANQYLNDFFIGGVGGSVFTDQVPGGWYAPLKPLIVAPDVLDDSKWLGGFNAGFLDSEGSHIYTVQADGQNNFNVNRDEVSQADLDSLEGLFDPKWKGKIASLDPRIQGDQSLTLIFHLFGEDGLRRFLTEQKPVLTRNRRQLAEWAVRGAYPVTLGVSPGELAQWRQEGLGQNLKQITLAAEQTPWTPGWGGVALLQNIPHPNAAKIFINWFLGKEAQADWATRGLNNSRRTDVPKGLPDNVVSEAAFVSGLTFNSAKLAGEPKRAFEIATEVLG
jgi:iron(III) transport system substrate-binding protein